MEVSVRINLQFHEMVETVDSIT